ncbi:hypothetical protein L226DRAFT_446345, partial [Lentinus tigrinus ALCF2SS1-7]|uniref:uncharacterized protein n=1 Tax=Lentinus tigrinus ALCF2SS1-7 TaxID=1328758 RepID=UPI0011663EC0
MELEPFIIAALTMVSVAHAMAGVSRPIAGYILSTLQVVLVGAMFLVQQRSTATPRQKMLMNILPRDVRASMKLLGVVPDIVSYGCC